MLHENLKDSQTDDSWRWLILPFAAVIGAVIGTIVFAFGSIFLQTQLFGFNNESKGLVYHLIMSFATFGWLYVFITLSIAPKHKVIAAVIMTSILNVSLLWIAISSREWDAIIIMAIVTVSATATISSHKFSFCSNLLLRILDRIFSKK